MLVDNFRFSGKEKSFIALFAKGGRFLHEIVMYRETLPSLDELRDPEKIRTILSEFGEQHRWTSGWGDPDEDWHWSESWCWFTVENDGRLRKLSVFTHVSQRNSEPKRIDDLLVREGYFRLSDPSNEDDLKEFPLPSTLKAERQRLIDERDDNNLEPLRSFLKARHKPGDSGLMEYFAAIRAFRKKPNEELLNQLIAQLDDGTCEIKSMTETLFRSYFDEKIGHWEPSKKKEACRLMINALPHANSSDSLNNALVIILAETGIESFEFNLNGIQVSLKSTAGQFSYSFQSGRFNIGSKSIQQAGEAIRDDLLKRYDKN
jgi:hypothetical protein